MRVGWPDRPNDRAAAPVHIKKISPQTLNVALLLQVQIYMSRTISP
jgi:hypothetical protein